MSLIAREFPVTYKAGALCMIVWLSKLFTVTC